MQERKKKKIVIASVLKPVDETRMFGKIAISLAKAGHEVHVFGNTATGIHNEKHIFLYSHHLKSRLSLARLLIHFILLRKWLAIRPQVILIASHELLITAILYKLLRSVKLIYDVQENYYLNILHTNAFPKLLRYPIAFYVRLKEWLFAPFIHHFLLAESIYAKQLRFTKGAFTIIPNTVRHFASSDFRKKGWSNWFFSGTLAESTGIFSMIDFAKTIHRFDDTLQLTIYGYAPLLRDQKRIHEVCDGHGFISLKGIENFVSHAEILDGIRKADVGLIYYPIASHTNGRIPTKFYEYSSLSLPILTWSDQPFAHNITSLGLGWVLNGDESPEQVLATIKLTPEQKPLPQHHFWEFSEKTLLEIIDSQ